tara:strand:- start:116 stop:301 length:186 start_codon:yes stop_codon:yes gene_type:complete
MRYLDYEFTIDEDCIEFDTEITMSALKRHGNFKEGDMLVLIELDGKVNLVNADKLPEWWNR